jgi:hypothetical protein
MKLKPAPLFAAPLLLVLGTAAHAACVYPQAPQNFPNGTTATKEDMLAALDSSDAEAYAQQKTAIEEIHAKKHNAAVDEISAIAARWSEEIKAFNAKGK